MSFYCYLKFRDEVVDFSANTSSKIKKPAATEYASLQATYGKEAVERWSHIGTKEIPLHKEQLNDEEKGYCLGMSMDFVAQYLQKMEAGCSPLEAIRKIAPQYLNGAPPEAALAQIFHGALDRSNIEAAKCSFKKRIKTEKEELVKWAEKEVNKATEEAQLKRFKKQLEEQMKNWHDASRRDMWIESEKLLGKLDQITAKSFGLSVREPLSCSVRKAREGKQDPEFEAFVHNLPQGAYLVGVRGDPGHHAIAFIKTAEKHFIYDPNLGTLAVEPKASITRLWEVAKIYLKNGIFAFFPTSKSA